MPSSRGSSQLRDQTCISYGLLHWQAGSLSLMPCTPTQNFRGTLDHKMRLCIGKKILATPQMIWILYKVRCLLLVFWSQGRVLAAMVKKRYSKEKVSVTCCSLYDSFCLKETNKKANPFLLLLISVHSLLQSKSGDVAWGDWWCHFLRRRSSEKNSR